MMPIVSWIEDEANLLKDLREELARLKGSDKLVIYPDATSAVRAMDRIRADNGPIILDLMIPPGAEPLPQISARLPTILGTPEIGLRLLHLLREKLGASQPIFIISGNIMLETVEHILREKLVPRDAMITKPLTTKKIERLLKLIAEAIATRCHDDT